MNNRFVLLQQAVISIVLSVVLSTAYATGLTACPTVDEVREFAHNQSAKVKVDILPVLYDPSARALKQTVMMTFGTKIMIVYPVLSSESDEFDLYRLIDDSVQLETQTPITELAIHDEEAHEITSGEIGGLCSYISTKNPDLHVTFWVNEFGEDIPSESSKQNTKRILRVKAG